MIDSGLFLWQPYSDPKRKKLVDSTGEVIMIMVFFFFFLVGYVEERCHGMPWRPIQSPDKGRKKKASS